MVRGQNPFTRACAVGLLHTLTVVLIVIAGRLRFPAVFSTSINQRFDKTAPDSGGFPCTHSTMGSKPDWPIHQLPALGKRTT